MPYNNFQVELMVPTVLGLMALVVKSFVLKMAILVVLNVSGLFLFCCFTFNVISKIADVLEINVLTVGEKKKK